MATDQQIQELRKLMNKRDVLLDIVAETNSDIQRIEDEFFNTIDVGEEKTIDGITFKKTILRRLVPKDGFENELATILGKDLVGAVAMETWKARKLRTVEEFLERHQNLPKDEILSILGYREYPQKKIIVEEGAKWKS
jgi:hypothetical protein